MSVADALLFASGLKSQMSVRNWAPPKPGTRPATMNQPLVVAGEKAAGAAAARPIPTTTARPRAIHFMGNLPRPSDARGDREVYTEERKPRQRLVRVLRSRALSRKVYWPRSGRFRC